MESTDKADLLSLPSELVLSILSFLPADALSSVSQSCRFLHSHAMSESLWEAIIQSYLPTTVLESPFPFDSYRKLYASQHPHWFLLKHQVWMGDSRYTGKVLISVYDARRGSIEGYQLAASNQVPGQIIFQQWQPFLQQYVQAFMPKVTLHKDRPLLQLNTKPPEQWAEKRSGPYGLAEEVVMPSADFGRGVQHATFMTARALPEVAQHATTSLWPPKLIPSPRRVRNESRGGFRDSGHTPATFSTVCENAFRIRQWGQFTDISRLMGVHMGETVTTYGAIAPELYTPTAEKPWRGLWVGDYSGHGCEFILIHQPDDEVGGDPKVLESSADTLERDPRNTTNQLCTGSSDPSMSGDSPDRSDGPDIYRGKLEAIKLTGDTNVPRGEFTFRVDDLGQSGLVRILDEAPFAGARMVRAQGQIAETYGFNDVQQIETQLILISKDRLAHDWGDNMLVSYLERVPIDELTASVWADSKTTV